MRSRRTGALVTAAFLSLAACATASDDSASPATDNRAAADEQPAATGEAAQDDADEAAAPSTGAADTAEPEATDAPADANEPDDADEAEDTGEAGIEEAVEEPVATEAPAPAEPIVGGRLFAADVQPEAQFEGNPFPNLVVDDIGKDARVNIANILPSDRPVLLWAWAPH